MKLKQTALLVMGMLPLGVFAQANNPQTPVPPSNMHIGSPSTAEMPDRSKLSYAVGMYLGEGLMTRIKSISVDNEIMLKAIKDVVDGNPKEMTDGEVHTILTQFSAAMKAKQQAENEESNAKNEAFMAQFAKTPGATTLPNGLEYLVVKEGNGDLPQANDTVTVTYRGTLPDGTEFDHNDNWTTPIKKLITGWQQILPLMKVGSKWHIAIPPNLAYGVRGMPPRIPANTVLVFDLELVAITPTLSAVATGAPGAPTPNSQSSTSTPVVSGEIIKVPSAEEMKNGAKIEVIKSGQTNTMNSQ